MAQHEQRQRDTGAGPALQWKHRVSRVTGEPAPCALLGEAALREGAGGGEPGPNRFREPARAETAPELEQPPYRGRVWPEQNGLDLAPSVHEWPHERAIGIRVVPELGRGRGKVALEQESGPVVERMGSRRGCSGW